MRDRHPIVVNSISVFISGAVMFTVDGVAVVTCTVIVICVVNQLSPESYRWYAGDKLFCCSPRCVSLLIVSDDNFIILKHSSSDPFLWRLFAPWADRNLVPRQSGVC